MAKTKFGINSNILIPFKVEEITLPWEKKNISGNKKQSDEEEAA